MRHARISVFVVACVLFGRTAAQQTCKTPDQNNGFCVPMNECRGTDTTDVERLRQLECGTDEYGPLICCQDDTTVTEELPANCVSPDGVPGTCISVYDCPLAVALLSKRQPLIRIDQEYLTRAACQGGRNSICCAPSLGSALYDRSNPNGFGNGLLPASDKCGREVLGDRIVGGSDAGIDQYPWTILVGYMTKYNTTSRVCGGVLISKRYVLTAAHCLFGQIIREIGVPINVRLGEWDTSTESDCYNGDCTDPIVDVPIESIHPYLGFSSKDAKNDIGLIRLAYEVESTDFIRPICLPAEDRTLAPGFNKSTRYIVAGWGQSDDGMPSKIKQHLPVPYIRGKECRGIYKRLYNRILGRHSQLCAGGEPGKDSCVGDSGGPLMLNTDNVWTVEGIVSFGPQFCGQAGVPGVYTNIAYFLPWIAGIVKP